MSIDLNLASSFLGISKDELKKLIEQKKKEFFDLIDEETALMIILKEKGIKLDIENIRIIDLFSNTKVPKIFVVIEKILYQDDKKSVYLIYDNTAKAKLIVLDKANLQPGDVIEIKNALVRKNKFIYLLVKSFNQISNEVPKEIQERLLSVNPKQLGFVYEGIATIKNKKLLTEKFDLYITNEESGTYHVKAIVKNNFAEVFWKSDINYDKIFPQLRRLLKKRS